MILDFRVQPPFKSFLDTHWFRPRPPVEDLIGGNAFGKGRWPIPSFDEQSIELFVQEMDEVDIDVGVVMGQRTGERGGNAENDDVAELVNRYPDRFVGFGGVDPLDAGAVAEITRCVRDLGCRGIAITPGWSDPPLYDDDGRVYPIYQACLDLNVPVMITSSHFIGADMSYSMPTHIQKVALDFPKLAIIVGHGCWPWTMQACAMAMRCRNIYLMPEIYLHPPDMPGADDYVRAANSYLSHRMLYSSCYPTLTLGQAMDHFQRLPIKPESRENMLGHNGARLLGLLGAS
jgi:predicted TIM-barrel fold metal-dependent hydrolase